MTDSEKLKIFISCVPRKYSSVIPHLTVENTSHFLNIAGEVLYDPGNHICYKGIAISDVTRSTVISQELIEYFTAYFIKDIATVDMLTNPLYIAVNGNIAKDIDTLKKVCYNTIN